MSQKTLLIYSLDISMIVSSLEKILHNVLPNHQRFVHFSTREKKFDSMYLICLINDELFTFV